MAILDIHVLTHTRECLLVVITIESNITAGGFQTHHATDFGEKMIDISRVVMCEPRCYEGKDHTVNNIDRVVSSCRDDDECNHTCKHT